MVTWLISTVAAVVVAALLEDEAKSSLRDVARWLARCATRRLPPDLHERYAEEWLADLDERPTALRQVSASLGFFVSAARITHEHCFPSVPFRSAVAVRALDLSFGVIYLTLVLPLILFSVIVLFSSCGLPLFVSHQRIGRMGQSIRVYKFRALPTGDTRRTEQAHAVGAIGKRVQWLLRVTRFNEVPMVFGLVTGDLALVGPCSLPRNETELVEMQASKLKPGIVTFRGVALARGLQPDEGSQTVREEFERNYSVITSLKMLADVFWFVAREPLAPHR